ncbi:MAG: hypothetical protein AAGC93_27700 [Cyanobacteria bacterium P01_F01_bin.53]
MHLSLSKQPDERALVDSLSVEQMVLLAKWLSSEVALKEDKTHQPHIAECLGEMAHRIRGLAQKKIMRDSSRQLESVVNQS